ncbi:hypothetical protein BABINDRAFT_163711 [Babjeviella inositovora NRRL Y-12698]|uniref:Palmitoyltransferase n=1 Tax=Babjeviella inositovora NRRL Y-12698 TaxID=984486 RepID=A0A1E3QHL4_9ASCO|nr:uncharacterized protein BABINDRAFT_163711 [Babjeviella inositovora NRRL Y-12698]ODQ77203.1 hypothetical protein BABINDRAFT_163711 [Babjeviella inositovora NRRL Y-12698]
MLSFLKRWVVPNVTPILLIGLYGYVMYSFCHELAYKLIYLHYGLRAFYLAAVVVYSLLAAITLALWFQLKFLADPGTFAPQQHLDNIEQTPYFLSDPYGFPLFCSSCQSYKPLRVHHSTNHGRCVVKFDHFCIFLNAVVGYANYPVFIKLLVWFTVKWLFVLIVDVIFVNRVFTVDRHVNIHLIALAIACGFWLMLAGGLLASNLLKYIGANFTTVEEIAKRKPLDLHLSVVDGSLRKVVKIDPDLRSSLFDTRSFKQNWNQVFYCYQDRKLGSIARTVAYILLPFFDPWFVTKTFVQNKRHAVTIWEYNAMSNVKISDESWEIIQQKLRLDDLSQCWVLSMMLLKEMTDLESPSTADLKQRQE